MSNKKEYTCISIYTHAHKVACQYIARHQLATGESLTLRQLLSDLIIENLSEYGGVLGQK